MSEKMLVTQALDERDLLVKKISDKIEKASFVDTIKPNEEKVYAGRCGKEEFAKDAQAAYQQITDLMDRFQKIDAAIVASNAKAEDYHILWGFHSRRRDFSQRKTAWHGCL